MWHGPLAHEHGRDARATWLCGLYRWFAKSLKREQLPGRTAVRPYIFPALMRPSGFVGFLPAARLDITACRIVASVCFVATPSNTLK